MRRLARVLVAWIFVVFMSQVVVAQDLDESVFRKPPAPRSYQIHVVDVGTGLATVIEGADFLAVYDGGSNDDISRGAKNRLLAYLRYIRPELNTIDHIILSHPHRDHVELLPDLLDAYRVSNVWDSGRPFAICAYRAFVTKIAANPSIDYHDALGDHGTRQLSFGPKSCYGKKLKAEKVSLRESSRIGPERVQLGVDAFITFLHADGVPKSEVNENSLVALFELGGVRILFPGDAQAGGRGRPSDLPRKNSVEEKLLACCADKLKAELLIAGHHGSRTSSRDLFLDAVSAKFFAVSSGPTKYNTVVLPDRIVINDMARRGTVINTNNDDRACKKARAKVGPDKDGRAGGCTNIVFAIGPNNAISGRVWSPSD